MRPSIRCILLLFIAAVLAYKYMTAGHSTTLGFTAAIEASYGDSSGEGFFTGDVKLLLCIAGFLLITYLPLGQVADDVEDIWSSERRRRMPQTH